MTELEEKIKAKIPGEDTGIAVKKTLCDMCTPLCHCGIDAYVRDGRVIKIEGTKGHPMNDGALCTKGASNRGYIYRADRLKTPLRRTGPRGSGKYAPVSWEEAYEEITKKLLAAKEETGADSVMFYSGYGKWYRFMLQRLAYAFGSVNYGAESSTCFTANRMAWMTMTGKFARPDLSNARLYLAWASPTHYSRWTNANSLDNFKRRGGKVILVDPRVTPTAQRSADLHLRVKPGTDGLLANCLAGLLIKNGWHDEAYIKKYVHGFDEYAAHVCSVSPKETARVTGVPEELIEKAAEMIGTIRPMSVENSPGSLIHQTNGFQTSRAVFALSAITGNYDRPGGNQPLDFGFCEQACGFLTEDEAFATELMPADFDRRVGVRRFPIWGKLIPQAQCTDLPRQILEGTPYPIRSLVACGMNYRMFPDSTTMKRALESLDFFVDIDLFLTDSAKLADLVLPCVSSFEREEFKVYPGGFAAYYKAAIPPYGESRSDAQIISELCAHLGIEDEYLLGGYRRCIEHVIRKTGLDIDERLKSDLPVKAPPEIMIRPAPLGYLEHGCKTKTGKLELKSELVASCGEDYEPVPKWVPPDASEDEEYPFILMTGVRIPNAIHSRLHNVPWARELRPEPSADISREDARRLNVEAGDSIVLRTQKGAVTVKANPTAMIAPGQVYLFHDYPEADASSLLNGEALDPYSGFPGYLSACCAVEKVSGGAKA